jgi:uncharacterized protein (TIGR03435 family)
MRRTILAVFLSHVAFAQAPAFEVASIRPASFPSDSYFMGFSAAGTCGAPPLAISGNRVTLPRVTLCTLIRLAYNVPDYRISGLPGAMTKADQSNYFDVRAEAEEGALTQDQARAMLQTLLADRFQLKLHRETKELPIYALVIGKSGSKLSTQPLPCAANPRPAATQPGRGFSMCNATTPMSRLTLMLSQQITDRPILDKTGLTGQYAFILRWSPEGTDSQPDSPPSIFTAVQEQLGLKLDPQKAPMEMLAIDHAEPPSTN